MIYCDRHDEANSHCTQFANATTFIQYYLSNGFIITPTTFIDTYHIKWNQNHTVKYNRGKKGRRKRRSLPFCYYNKLRKIEFVVCSLFADCLQSLCRLFAVCLQSVCSLFADCLQPVCRPFAVCLQSVCSLFTVCLQSVCRPFAVCLPSVCSLFTVCLPSVCSLFAVCLQSVYNKQNLTPCHTVQYIALCLIAGFRRRVNVMRCSTT